MKIVYIGRVSLVPLAERFRFNRDFPKVNWGFGIGSDVVSGLVKRGHEVHVITLHSGIRSTATYISEATEDGQLVVHLVPGRATKWQFLTLYNREVRLTRKLVRSIKPDVVFAQWTYENAYVGLTSGFPTLCVGHDSPWTVLKTFRNVYALFHAFYAQIFVVPRMKHLSVVSPHIDEDFRKQCHYKGEITLIPNGMEIGIRGQGLGIREEAKTIVCVSQAGRLKNTQALVKAFEILKPKHPDWRLKMYGQGLPDGMASREELDRVLREEADVFCSPSLEESFGMVFVEAMLQGVPCIGGEKSGAVPWVLGVGEVGSREVGSREVGSGEVGSGEVGSREVGSRETGAGGVVCDVTDPVKLAACLERVMLDYELRKRLSENGQKRVREMFDIERVVDAYEAKLKEVAREG